MRSHKRQIAHAHYDHVGAFYHPGLGETFTPSSVTFMDVRAGTSTISRGARSDAVAQLQRLLNSLNFRDQSGQMLDVDRLFGAKTQAALRGAQSAIRAKSPSTVMIDGTLDKATLAALDTMQPTQPSQPPMTPSTFPSSIPSSIPGAPPAVIPGIDASKLQPSRPWFKNPWVLGGGAVALIAAAAFLMGDDKKA